MALTPEAQADMDRQFAELETTKRITGEWKDGPRVRNLSEREVELNEKDDELFGSDTTERNEAEEEMMGVLRTNSNELRKQALQLRAYLNKAWFQMFEAAKFTKEMHFGAVIAVVKDEAVDEKIREIAEVYFSYMENAQRIIKRPDNNDNFWLLVRKIRIRWEKEVSINWRAIMTRELMKMEYPK